MLYKLLAVALCLLAYGLISRLMEAMIRRFAVEHRSAAYRVAYVVRTTKIALIGVTALIVCIVLGIGYGQIHLFLSSVFAVIGIALFAQWSILCNITASLIIFFSFPYRLGDKIKIVDGGDPLIGTIEQITLFHVLIKEDSGDIITYPNAILLQKPVIKLRGTGFDDHDILDDG